jgi:hypothetical protein
VPFFFDGAPHIADDCGKGAKAPLPTQICDFLATCDGLGPVRAFTQIGDSELPRSIVRLVEEIAGDVGGL